MPKASSKPAVAAGPPSKMQQRAAVGKAVLTPALSTAKKKAKAQKRANADARFDRLHLLMADGISNDRRQYLARKETPLVAHHEGVKEFRAISNLDLVSIMFDAFCRAYGFVPGRSILQSLGFGGGGVVLGLITGLWLVNQIFTADGDVWHAIRSVLTIAATVGGGVAGYWIARYTANGSKFAQAYCEFLIIEFGSRDDERAITASADGYLPRLAFATTTGYMKGHSEASGIRRGFALMWTNYDRPLRTLRMSEVLGKICPACDDGGVQVFIPTKGCRDCVQPLPPLSGLDLIKTVGERFYGNASDTMYSLMMQAFEAGELQANRGRRNSLFKQIKGWVIWVIIILLIIFNFLAFAVGLDSSGTNGG